METTSPKQMTHKLNTSCDRDNFWRFFSTNTHITSTKPNKRGQTPHMAHNPRTNHELANILRFGCYVNRNFAFDIVSLMWICSFYGCVPFKHELLAWNAFLISIQTEPKKKKSNVDKCRFFGTVKINPRKNKFSFTLITQMTIPELSFKYVFVAVENFNIIFSVI